MNRLTICLISICLASNCAHVTEHVSHAPSLLELITQLGGDEPASPAAASDCPSWVKIDGPIDEETSKSFVSTLAACSDRPVVVEINSPGGNVFAALDMQKAIERHPHPVFCVVDGLAASAAFITLQSCSMRLMTNRSVIMAHHAAAPQASGQALQLANVAAALHALDRGNALHCAARMGMPVDDFEKHVADGREWWMGLEEARENNAVDHQVADVGEALKLAASSVEP